MTAWPGSRLPVRARVTAAATLALLGALVVVGLLFSRALRSQERGALDRACEERVADTIALVRDGRVATPLPAARDSALLVQVIRPDGTVAGSSANVMDMDTPFVDMARHPVRVETESSWTTMVDGARVRLFGRAVASSAGTWAVYVASPLVGVESDARALERQMLRWLPLALVLGGVLLWVVVGRALRPVDVMRAEVDAIGPGELGRRVTVPPVRDEVGRLAATMNAMLDRVEEASDRQARFVSDASHELRSPLATLRTRLEVALRHPDRADWPDVTRSALAQGARMERLVADLLALARLGEGAGTPGPTRRWASMDREVDLGDVVMAVVAEVRATARPDVTVDISGVAGGRVLGDPDDLGRLVGNLLTNAVRHARSTVVVRAQTIDGSVIVEVDDDGPGIPSAERERVFERFVRLDEARARTDGGSGLGLSIASEIVRRHGGAVEVGESVRLGGASFRVTLPEA